VPLRDSAALAAAVGRVLEDKDLAASFAQAGMRRVAELFSMERSVRETEHLYQRLVEAGGCV
jgi:glycosyltransferase involved in cell wall biosynthesis